MKKKILIVSLSLVLIFAISSVVFAQESLPACTGEEMTGTLVDFDETTQTVVLADEFGNLCTVMFQQNADYGHPITTLLGNYFEEYFGSYDSESFSEALANTQVCVEAGAEAGDWVLTDPQPDDLSTCATTARVMGSNGDGSFVLLFGDGTTGMLQIAQVPAAEDVVCVVDDDDPLTENTFILADDQDTCAGFLATVDSSNGDGTFVLTFEDETTGTLALANFDTYEFYEGVVAGLMEFTWALSGEGIAAGVGDAIAEKHDEGFGFGVIVKLYAIAMDGGWDLDELFQKFEDGMGMGQIFKEYGKPSKLGVGHVRQDSGGVPGASGQCNPNANANSAVACENGENSGDVPPKSNKNKDKVKTNNGKPHKDK